MRRIAMLVIALFCAPVWAVDMTPAQRLALKQHIEANNLSLWQTQQIGALVAAYNAPTAFVVWRTSVPVDEINDAIVWSNYTPSDAVPTGDALSVAVWQARSQACQGKQFNLQLIMASRGSLPGNRSTIRSGLQDALTGIPSGAGGALQSAGWTAVRAVLQRTVSVGERIYATGTGTSGTPGTVVVEGAFDESDIIAAMGL